MIRLVCRGESCCATCICFVLLGGEAFPSCSTNSFVSQVSMGISHDRNATKASFFVSRVAWRYTWGSHAQGGRDFVLLSRRLVLVSWRGIRQAAGWDSTSARGLSQPFLSNLPLIQVRSQPVCLWPVMTLMFLTVLKRFSRVLRLASQPIGPKPPTSWYPYVVHAKLDFLGRNCFKPFGLVRHSASLFLLLKMFYLFFTLIRHAQLLSLVLRHDYAFFQLAALCFFGIPRCLGISCDSKKILPRGGIGSRCPVRDLLILMLPQHVGDLVTLGSEYLLVSLWAFEWESLCRAPNYMQALSKWLISCLLISKATLQALFVHVSKSFFVRGSQMKHAQKE